MSLDLSSSLSPAPTPFTSPDFITTHSRKSFHPATQIPRLIADQRSIDQHEQASPHPVVDRRISREPNKGHERRQFGSSHVNLSPAAAELAVAIDQYKLEHRRRYITCEEMLMVITKLGYSR